MRAVVVDEFGGPEVLVQADVDRPSPGPGEVLVDVSVSGVNFLDVYQRTGASPLRPPFSAGVEGVGVVAEIGEMVTDLRAGQRVGWLTGGQGSFADAVVVTADKAVAIPDEIDDERAAAVLMQGVTAQYLATDTYPIQPGDPVLIHAAAGGVGQLLTQIAKIRGKSDARKLRYRSAGDDDRNVPAQVLCFFQVVRRQDDGRTRCIDVPHEGPHRTSHFDIHPRSRLIQDHQLGFMHECARDHQASLHAA